MSQQEIRRFSVQKSEVGSPTETSKHLDKSNLITYIDSDVTSENMGQVTGSSTTEGGLGAGIVLGANGDLMMKQQSGSSDIHDPGSTGDPGNSGADNDQLLKSPTGDPGASTNLFLYKDDMAERPKMATAIHSLANYSAAIPSS